MSDAINRQDVLAAIEECARMVEEYPSPLNDLPMALAMRDVAAAIRALKTEDQYD